MANCINQSDLILEENLNQTFSTDNDSSSQFDANFSRIINTIALPTVCMFGIVGNILNLTILTRRKLQKSFRSLEQAANLCLIALAVSDLMFCVLAFLFTFLPETGVYHGKGLIYFYRMYSTAFINLFIMESTMLTVAMSLERYMAICFPLRQDLYLTTRRIKYIIVGSFIFSLAFNVPVLWRFESHLICPDSNSNFSQLSGEDSSEFVKYNNFSSETLVSAHFKEDENPVSPKNNNLSSSSLFSLLLSSTTSTTTKNAASSFLSKLSASSSSHKNTNSMSSLSKSTLSPISTSSPSSSSSLSSSSSSSSQGDRYIIKTVPLWGNQAYELAYRILWAIVGNFIPLVLLFFFNVCLCRNIYLSYKLRRQFKRQNQTKSSSHILTVTLVVIVVMFFILVAPSEIVLMAGKQEGTSLMMESIFNFLQSLNFSLNFILYCIISRHFRKTLKYIFLCGCYNIYQVSRDWKKEFETSLM